MKKIYYKGLNSFTLRQFSSKINITVFSMTVICLMLFITICVLSSAISMKNSMTANLKKLAPADIEMTKKVNISSISKYYSQKEIEDAKISLEETLNRLEFNINTNFKDIIQFNTYKINNLTLKSTLGEYFQIAKKSIPYFYMIKKKH